MNVPRYVVPPLGEWAGEPAPPGAQGPRFVVRSVTGYNIGGALSGRGPYTDYYVLDAAVCYREVYRASTRIKDAAAKTATVCAGLNAGKTPLWDQAGRFRGWKAEPRARYQHGTLSAYTNDRCRCVPCKAARAEYERGYVRRKRA